MAGGGRREGRGFLRRNRRIRLQSGRQTGPRPRSQCDAAAPPGPRPRTTHVQIPGSRVPPDRRPRGGPARLDRVSLRLSVLRGSVSRSGFRLIRPVGELHFPNPVFAWATVLLLVGLLARVAINDFRTLKIPNRMTLSILAGGLLMNLLRGAWLGGLKQRVFLLSPTGAGLGAIDGLLFAIAGFALAFGVFFLLWVLGTGGGGDVKLFAAIGAWVGPGEALRILFGSVVVVALTLFVQVVRGTGTRAPPGGGDADGEPGANPEKKRKRIQSFALPLTISSALVLAWDCRRDLGLSPAAELRGERGRPAATRSRIIHRVLHHRAPECPARALPGTITASDGCQLRTTRLAPVPEEPGPGDSRMGHRFSRIRRISTNSPGCSSRVGSDETAAIQA
ncbi:MAG: prepilin peptidase [Planctomycetota bacterium]|nr:MAG: prepilin peptidase [Planctomycetota bacterium]